MKSVVHAHWRYDERLPKTVYIYRDGRDVMVSLLNYQMKSMADDRHPRSAQKGCAGGTPTCWAPPTT